MSGRSPDSTSAEVETPNRSGASSLFGSFSLSQERKRKRTETNALDKSELETSFVGVSPQTLIQETFSRKSFLKIFKKLY